MNDSMISVTIRINTSLVSLLDESLFFEQISYMNDSITNRFFNSYLCTWWRNNVIDTIVFFKRHVSL